MQEGSHLAALSCFLCLRQESRGAPGGYSKSESITLIARMNGRIWTSWPQRNGMDRHTAHGRPTIESPWLMALHSFVECGQSVVFRVDHKNGQQPGGLGLAGILADDVVGSQILVPSLSRFIGMHRLALNLATD